MNDALGELKLMGQWLGPNVIWRDGNEWLMGLSWAHMWQFLWLKVGLKWPRWKWPSETLKKITQMYGIQMLQLCVRNWLFLIETNLEYIYAVVLLCDLCLKCATSVADEAVEVSQACPGSWWVLAASWGTFWWPLHRGFSHGPCHVGQGWALPGQLPDHNGGRVVCSVTQLYLDATVVCQELVVPHWDHSGNNLSIYLWNVWNTKCPGHKCLVYKQWKLLEHWMHGCETAVTIFQGHVQMS